MATKRAPDVKKLRRLGLTIPSSQESTAAPKRLPTLRLVHPDSEDAARLRERQRQEAAKAVARKAELEELARQPGKVFPASRWALLGCWMRRQWARIWRRGR
jgi:hypothetical protein